MTRLISALALLLACPLSGSAAVFFVTNTHDSGLGSLRSAIDEANAAGPGAHQVRFDGPFPQDGLVQLGSTLPTLTAAQLTIHGNGYNPRIAGNDTFPLLVAASTLSRLELNGLTLSSGRATDEGGGCLAAHAAGPSSTLVIQNSRFDNCAVVQTSGWARGGAIFWNFGFVTIRDSEISHSFASTQGGTQSDIAFGGAITTHGELLVERSRFITNTAIGHVSRGGAVTTTDSAVIRDSFFHDNFAFSTATPGRGQAGAVLIDCVACDAVLERNTFTANFSDWAGAVFVRGNQDINRASLVAHNNTFHGNEGALSAGALYAQFVSASLVHNTFHHNLAPADAAGHVYFESAIVENVANNVFAPTAGGKACMGWTIEMPGLDAGNLAADGTCGLLVPGIAANAVLGPVEVDYSPAVPVVRFAAGSPVIDGGDDKGCLAQDVLGNARPIDGNGDGHARCDVGAYEHPLDDTLFADGFEALP